MRAAAPTACPRCGGALAQGQEYCLECGVRVPGRTRVGAPRAPARRLLLPVAGTFVIAAGAAVAAIIATWEGSGDAEVLVATGGSVLVAERPESKLAVWPRERKGWTIVLVSVPKREGRQAALERAAEARARRLPSVGILDSARVASLHPGYWVVFSGVYDSKPEATSVLVRARTVARTATTRAIVP